jgi:ribosomal protein S18 acetylase RimI-like enzyme
MGAEGREETGTSPAENVVRLRQGGPHDAEFAARLHESGISSGFLSSLGPKFLRRLYRRIATTQGSFLIVAERGATRVGFVAGSASLGALYHSFVLRDGFAVLPSVFVPATRQWRQVLETLRQGSSRSQEPGGAELLAMAVDPEWRGRRVGRRLVDAFFDELVVRGVDAARVVVGADNSAAIALYRAAGFDSGKPFEVHASTPSLVLRWRAPWVRARGLDPPAKSG